MISAVFAVPSYGKQPSFEHELAALDALDKCKNAGIAMKWRIRPGDPYISKCRSVMGTEFLADHSDATDFFFWDDDVGGENLGTVAVRMLQRDEDVIAGVYPKKQNDILNEPVYRKDGTEIPAGELCWCVPLEWPVTLQVDKDTKQPLWKDGLVLGSLVPTGFLRIKRRVLEACAAQSGVYTHLDSARGAFDCYDLFRTGFVPDVPDGMRGRWWGEDFFFSFMVRQLGFEIWIDPDIEFTHSGQNAWRGNFINTLQRRTATPAMAVGEQRFELDICTRGDASGSPLTLAVANAFRANGSFLNKEAKALPGMSGRKFRDFLNNLISLVEIPRYLEIGVWKGATAIAALSGNIARGTLIDDWSEFGGPKPEFTTNMLRYVGSSWTLIEQDYRKVDYAALGLHNIYFFDGPHTYEDQHEAVTVALDALAPEWVFIVDDWNIRRVREGTLAGIFLAGFQVLYSIEIRTTLDDTEQLTRRCEASDWHNGVFIAVLQRKASEIELQLAAE